jgi:hypothetical protein
VTAGSERVRFLFVVALVAAGCAKPGFPPGGPIDTTPPRVVAAVPADSSFRVPGDQPLELVFSEAMDHVTVRDGLRLYPPPRDLSLHWRGRRLRVSWDGALEPKTTYQLVLSAGARDMNGVIMGAPLHVRFSTGDSLDPGAVHGVLRAKTLPTKNVPIALYPDSLGWRPDFGAIPPIYATETDTAGAYALTAVHVGRAYTLHALYDRNRDGAIDTTVDLVVTYPGAIRLTPERMVADSINLTAVDPQAPAIVTGTIAARDSTARFRVDARADSDTTFVVRRVERVGPGEYTLRLPAGRYRLKAVRLAGPGGQPPGSEAWRPEVLEATAEADIPGPRFEFQEGPAPAAAPGEPPPEPEEQP